MRPRFSRSVCSWTTCGSSSDKRATAVPATGSRGNQRKVGLRRLRTQSTKVDFAKVAAVSTAGSLATAARRLEVAATSAKSACADWGGQSTKVDFAKVAAVSTAGSLAQPPGDWKSQQPAQSRPAPTGAAAHAGGLRNGSRGFNRRVTGNSLPATVSRSNQRKVGLRRLGQSTKVDFAKVAAVSTAGLRQQPPGDWKSQQPAQSRPAPTGPSPRRWTSQR